MDSTAQKNRLIVCVCPTARQSQYLNPRENCSIHYIYSSTNDNGCGYCRGKLAACACSVFDRQY